MKPDVLDVLISPTTRCNLRCRYCFVKQTGNIDDCDLSLVDLRSAYQWLNEYAYNIGAKSIRVTWFGGEPLYLGVDYLHEALAMQKELVSLRIENFMQTNLTLITNHHIELFREYFNGAVGGSIDFGSDWRMFPDGSSCAECIETKIHLLLNAGIRIGAVCTLTRANVHKTRPMYGYFKDRNISFQVNRAAACPEMAKDGLLISVKEYEHAVIELCDLYLQDAEPTIDFHNLTLLVEGYAKENKVVCVDSEFPEYYIGIEAKGRIMPRCRFQQCYGNFLLDNPSEVCKKIKAYSFSHTCPGVCKTCRFFSKTCLGGCMGEPECDCQHSDCGYRTEFTKGLWEYIEKILLQKNISMGSLRA